MHVCMYVHIEARIWSYWWLLGAWTLWAPSSQPELERHSPLPCWLHASVYIPRLLQDLKCGHHYASCSRIIYCHSISIITVMASYSSNEKFRIYVSWCCMKTWLQWIVVSIAIAIALFMCPRVPEPVDPRSSNTPNGRPTGDGSSQGLSFTGLSRNQSFYGT